MNTEICKSGEIQLRESMLTQPNPATMSEMAPSEVARLTEEHELVQCCARITVALGPNHLDSQKSGRAPNFFIFLEVFPLIAFY